MKAIKLMIAGGLLILLGPIMSLVDICFSGFFALCWFVGVPLFLAGLLTPTEKKVTKQSEDLPQKRCPKCGKNHDFDYPKCPYCGNDYQTIEN